MEQSQDGLTGATACTPPMRPAWTAALLAIFALLGALDTQAFAVLLVPIQKDLGVGDAAMGLLTGSVTALAYALIALPMARRVDVSSRRNLLTLAVAGWSVLTAASGLVRGFTLLLIVRVGVGLASTVQVPAVNSLITDVIRPAHRGVALAVISAAAAVGLALGALLAGALSDRIGWHAVLCVVGTPGVLVAAVFLFTTAEPQRGACDDLGSGVVQARTLADALRQVLQIRSLYPLTIAIFLMNFVQSGWLLWMPAFLIRVHHLSATRMGVIFGTIIAAAIAGSLVGGIASDKLAARGPRWRALYCMGSMAVSTPLLALAALVPTVPQVLIVCVGFALTGGGIAAAATAAFLSVTPAAIRGVATASVNLVGGVLGAGLAPVVFGAVSDVIEPRFLSESLRYTLLLAPVGTTLAAVAFFVASRSLDDDAGGLTPARDGRADAEHLTDPTCHHPQLAPG